MKIYNIAIKETLEKLIQVESNSLEEAMKKVTQDYDEGKIVLDEYDFIDVEFGEWEEYIE